MPATSVIEIATSVIGGLGIFLLGMKNMSEGMQAIAGERLRKLVGSITNNRIAACAVGTLVTCCIQSSSVTTVMVVGFVNSGFMTLVQAIGVIIGANIGTTITGWILVLRIGKYGLPVLGIAALAFLFSRRDRIRYTAMTIMGVGMIFFGLELMAGGFQPLREVPEFVGLFARFTAHNYAGVLKCALAGCILTMIVQSSSATLGITIGLAETGIIPFPTAAALILGENIGTTITALLASIGATTNARRAAISHMIFNILGVIWITALFPVYMGIIERIIGVYPGTQMLVNGEPTFPYVRQSIALAHSGFNVANTLIFLPLLPLLARIVRSVLPEKKEKETPHLTFLDIRMLDTPAIGIQQSHDEIIQMSEHVQKMFVLLRHVITSKEIDAIKEKKLFHREEILDIVQKEITEFLSNLISGNISHTVMIETRKQLRISDEYESISDYIVNILKLKLKMRNSTLQMSEEGHKAIVSLHDHVSEYVQMVSNAMKEDDLNTLNKTMSQGDAITHAMKEYREKHLQRMSAGTCTPFTSLVFTDMLTSYRKIKDHALNIAEALAGEK